MTEADFNTLVSELKSGNNEALKVLQPFQGYCQKTLMIKSRNVCTADDAYDIFIDSILDFRKNVLDGKVQFKAVRAYLAQICWNKWMEKSRKQKRQGLKKGKVEKEFYKITSTESPEMQLVKREEKESETKENQHLVAKVNEVMKSLSGKCQKILKMAIIDEIPMIQIAELLGFSNANVAKTTKSRCYKQLVKKIRDQ